MTFFLFSHLVKVTCVIGTVVVSTVINIKIFSLFYTIQGFQAMRAFDYSLFQKTVLLTKTTSTHFTTVLPFITIVGIKIVGWCRTLGTCQIRRYFNHTIFMANHWP